MQQEFSKGNAIPVACFPSDSAAVADSRRLIAVVVDPQTEWDAEGATRGRIRSVDAEPRQLGPAVPRRSGVGDQKTRTRTAGQHRELLAWQRVARDVDEGLLGSEFSDANRNEVQVKVKEAEQEAREEVWASYRFVALLDTQAADSLKIIDLGIGHAGNGSTLAGRIVAALKSEALVSDNVSAGYIGRNWLPTFSSSGAWPLSSLRQSFLDGSLTTRLLDPDTVLREKIAESVRIGDFGLASGEKAGGGYERIWHAEAVPTEEVAFESGVFLLTKAKAEELRQVTAVSPPESTADDDDRTSQDNELPIPQPPPYNPPLFPGSQKARVSITGTIPRESWNWVWHQADAKIARGRGNQREDRTVGHRRRGAGPKHCNRATSSPRRPRAQPATGRQ